MDYLRGYLMNYEAILMWLVVLIFVGIIIYSIFKWRKLPVWLKGGLIGVASYWLLFLIVFVLVLLSGTDPIVIYITALPFYYLFSLFNFSEEFFLVGGTFIGSPLVFGLVGALIGLLVNKFKKRSSG